MLAAAGATHTGTTPLSSGTASPPSARHRRRRTRSSRARHTAAAATCWTAPRCACTTRASCCSSRSSPAAAGRCLRSWRHGSRRCPAAAGAPRSTCWPARRCCSRQRHTKVGRRPPRGWCPAVAGRWPTPPARDQPSLRCRRAPAACVPLAAGPGEPRLRHLPASQLPAAPGPRFAALFAAQPRWTREQLDPYLAALKVCARCVARGCVWRGGTPHASRGAARRARCVLCACR
jgi:hypothetical protein